MALYSIGIQTAVNNIDRPVFGLLAAEREARILEIQWMYAAISPPYTTQRLTLGRPGIPGVALASTLFQADNPSDPASTTRLIQTWTRLPTAPSVPMRRSVQEASTLAIGGCWRFPSGLVVPPFESVVMWVEVQSGQWDVNIIIEE